MRRFQKNEILRWSVTLTTAFVLCVLLFYAFIVVFGIFIGIPLALIVICRARIFQLILSKNIFNCTTTHLENTMNDEVHVQDDAPVDPPDNQSPEVIETTETVCNDETTPTPEVLSDDTQAIPQNATTPNVDIATFLPLFDALSKDVKSSLAEVKAQVDTVLSERTKTIDSLVNFTRAQLDANARDNLRIERMKAIYKLIWDNLQFVQETLAERPEDSILPRLQRRLTCLSQEFQKLLQVDGVRVIAPVRNELVDKKDCSIEREVACVTEEDLPGHIAQTYTIGFDTRGYRKPLAKVFIYASSPESTNQ